MFFAVGKLALAVVNLRFDEILLAGILLAGRIDDEIALYTLSVQVVGYWVDSGIAAFRIGCAVVKGGALTNLWQTWNAGVLRGGGVALHTAPGAPSCAVAPEFRQG